MSKICLITAISSVLFFLTACGGENAAGGVQLTTLKASVKKAPPVTSPDHAWQESFSGCHTPGDPAYAGALQALAVALFGSAVTPGGVGCVTLPYLANDYSYYWEEKKFSLQNHGGLDFRAPAGTAALSVKDGTVIRAHLEAKESRSTLVIESQVAGRMLRTWYLHCQSYRHIRQGQDLGVLAEGLPVLAGDEVCQTGDIGVPNQPHLHIEVKEVAMNAGRVDALSGSQCSPATFVDFFGKTKVGCDLGFIRANTVDPTVLLKPEPFFDDFTGSSLSAASWVANPGSGLSGFVTVGNGVVQIGNGASASTQGKRTFTGSRIVIESRFVGPKSWGRDSVIFLFDVASGDYFRFGDTSYQGLGLYTSGVGQFSTPLSGNGNSVNVYKEYRMTVDGNSLTVARGDTLSSLTESRTVTLPTSIAGKTFYIFISAGGNDGFYSPAEFDWIRVIQE